MSEHCPVLVTVSRWLQGGFCYPEFPAGANEQVRRCLVTTWAVHSGNAANVSTRLSVLIHFLRKLRLWVLLVYLFWEDSCPL